MISILARFTLKKNRKPSGACRALLPPRHTSAKTLLQWEFFFHKTVLFPFKTFPVLLSFYHNHILFGIPPSQFIEFLSLPIMAHFGEVGSPLTKRELWFACTRKAYVDKFEFCALLNKFDSFGNVRIRNIGNIKWSKNNHIQYI